MHVELARNRGAGRYLADISQERLKLAQVVEADEYINSQEENLTQRILELTDNLGADVIIVAASWECSRGGPGDGSPSGKNQLLWRITSRKSHH